MQNSLKSKDKQLRICRYSWLFGFVLFLSSCQNSSEQLLRVYEIAGENRNEIDKIIAHFSNNKKKSLKFKAAVYIVENMDSHEAIDDSAYNTYSRLLMQHKMPIATTSLDSLWQIQSIKYKEDLTYLKGDYLIQDIETAFAIRDSVPWGNSIPFEIFQEYVLPFKVTREKFVPNWRDTMYKKYKYLIDGITDPKEAYAKVLTYLKKNTREANSNFSADIDVVTMDHLKRGSCSQLNIYYVMILRSLGIPTAYDYVEYWGNYSQVGHSWISFVDNDNRTLTLANKDTIIREFNLIDASFFKEHYDEQHPDYQISQFKTTYKIYRKTYKLSNEEDRTILEHKQTPSKHKKDVSKYYGLSSSVRFRARKNESIASLSIFLTGKDWEEFDVTKAKNGHFHFRDLGKGVMYLPTIYSKNGEKKIGSPFYIDDHQRMVELTPQEETEQIILRRKYPLFGNWTYMWHRMKGAKIETSETEDFRFHKPIHTITELPIGIISIELANPIKVNNIRYLCPPDCRTPIAEFSFYDQNGNKIEIEKLLGGSIPDDQLRFAFDENELTSAATKIEEYWIGAKLRSGPHGNSRISRIDFMAKNDGNFISKGDIYHLYYFKQKWISLGEEQAKDKKLIYDNVPKGAVLLLKNLTKGKEERIFTMDSSKQIWW